MALKFDIEPGGIHLITETTHSAKETRTKYVRYNADLSQKRVNDEPWRDMSEADRAWFERHYAGKFEALFRSSRN